MCTVVSKYLHYFILPLDSVLKERTKIFTIEHTTLFKLSSHSSILYFYFFYNVFE